MAEYRANFQMDEKSLKDELAQLESKLARARHQRPSRVPSMPNYFELDRWFLNKVVLIGGGILIGALVAYFVLKK